MSVNVRVVKIGGSMKTKLYYRQCDSCKSGMSKGYIYHGDTYYFCDDECVGKYFGDYKGFTTLEDWNNNGPGLTWKEFQASWEVPEIIDSIRKRDFSVMDNFIWHYTRITLLNELLDEEE